MAVDMDFSKLTSGFNFSSGFGSTFITTLIWGLLIGAVIVVAIILIRNKIKYKYFGEVIKRRQEDFESNMPQAVYVSGKAGYFTKKGKSIFRIQYGMMPWQRYELTKLPDPKYMVGNKVYYLQLNKDNLVQAKISVDWTGGMNIEPVEDDLKYGAYLDIMERGKVLDTSKFNIQVVAFVAMTLVLVAGIVVYYFLSKA